MECPTVRIKATSGTYPYTTINEADFDPAKHERYVADAPAADAPAADAPAVSTKKKGGAK